MKEKISLIIIIVVTFLTCLTLYFTDTYRNGDEVVTYSMANSPKKGWMISEGRVQSYVRNRILDKNILKTADNIKDFVVDILKNKKDAEYFTYPRPTETGWIKGEEASSWFRVDKDEGFNISAVYLNAMGDDANPFMYFFLVHLVGYLLPQISALAWSAWIINTVAIIILLGCVYKLLKYLKVTSLASLIITLFVGLSYYNMSMVTYCRAYSVESLCQFLLFYIHVRYWISFIEKNEKKKKESLFLLIPIYLFGFLCHYTMLFIAGFLGLGTIFLHVYCKQKGLAKYIIAGLGSIMLGFVCDPESVVGLFMKLDETNSKKSLVGYVSCFNKNLVANYLWLFVLAVLVIFSIYIIIKKEFTYIDKILLAYLVIILLESVATYLVIGGERFGAICSVILFIDGYLIYRAVNIVEKTLIVDKKQQRQNLIIILLLLGVVATVNNYITVSKSNRDEGKLYKEVKKCLENNKRDTLLFARKQKGDYEFFNLFENYEDVLIITDNEDYDEVLRDLKKRNIRSISVILDNELDISKDIYLKLVNLGYLSKELLYSEEIIVYDCIYK